MPDRNSFMIIKNCLHLRQSPVLTIHSVVSAQTLLASIFQPFTSNFFHNHTMFHFIPLPIPKIMILTKNPNPTKNRNFLENNWKGWHDRKLNTDLRSPSPWLIVNSKTMWHLPGGSSWERTKHTSLCRRKGTSRKGHRFSIVTGEGATGFCSSGMDLHTLITNTTASVLGYLINSLRWNQVRWCSLSTSLRKSLSVRRKNMKISTSLMSFDSKGVIYATSFSLTWDCVSHDRPNPLLICTKKSFCIFIKFRIYKWKSLPWTPTWWSWNS